MIGSPSSEAGGVECAGYGLLGYAEHQFRLNARQKDGATLKDHLESVYRTTGKMPDQLVPVDVQEEIIYLWGWFCQLSSRRQSGMSGPLPITYTEMQAWSMLTGICPDTWEISVIERLDQVYLLEAHKK